MSVLHILAVIPVMIFLSSDWVQENVYDMSQSNMLDVMSRIPTGLLLLLLVVVAPLMEETVFRLWMNLKAWTIIVFTTGASFFVLQNFDVTVAFITSVVVLISSVIGIRKLRHHMDIHFNWWFYGSILAFGFAHIGNHQLTPAALLFVIPQILVGIAISMVRTRRGFWMGVLFHATWNGLASMAILYPYLNPSPRVTTTDTTTFEWRPGGLWDIDKVTLIDGDSLHFENYLVENAMADLIRLQEPFAVVEVRGLSLARVEFSAIGPLSEISAAAAEQWSKVYGLEIDTVIHTEDVYLLEPKMGCKPKSIPGESKMTLGLLDRYRTSENSQSISRSIREIYSVQAMSPMEDYHRSVDYILPLEGLDSALHALEVYSCIEHTLVEREVTRYIVQIPEL